MANIRNFQRSDQSRMKEIAPRAFGVWTRLALDKTLPKEKTEEYLRDEVSWYVRRVLRKEQNFGILVAEEDGNIVGYIVLGIDKVK